MRIPSNWIALLNLSGSWYYTEPENFASQWTRPIACPPPSGGKINSVMHSVLERTQGTNFFWSYSSFFLSALFDFGAFDFPFSRWRRCTRRMRALSGLPAVHQTGRLDPAVVASSRLIGHHHWEAKGAQFKLTFTEKMFHSPRLKSGSHAPLVSKEPIDQPAFLNTCYFASKIAPVHRYHHSSRFRSRSAGGPYSSPQG
ncbi:hypothetical protein BDW42DRAFT_54402 [Aspergillus taichungensis]|uniref:WW domain-containing protein n=1 Tax=Aspergillus taichungensis TaxID=482145 RepID=A0A2J5HD82_9EURO|nr:hypothetical protein BDW42DRAFT_54402 [Aspergillus taichungensis]